MIDHAKRALTKDRKNFESPKFRTAILLLGRGVVQPGCFTGGKIDRRLHGRHGFGIDQMEDARQVNWRQVDRRGGVISRLKIVRTSLLVRRRLAVQMVSAQAWTNLQIA